MIIIIILLISFIIWTYLVLNNYFTKLDLFFNNNLNRHEPFISIYKIYTNLGSISFYIPSFILFLIISSNKKQTIIFILFMLIIALFITIIKHLIKRERPLYSLVKESGYSYPSGHTTSATCFYGLISYFIIISSLIIPLKIILIIFLILNILFISYSRIFLGVHYLSDIIGGLLLGSTYLLLYIYLTNNLLNII